MIIILALVSFFGTRNLKETPGRFQCLLESIIEYFATLAEDIGGKNGRKFLPLILTIFIITGCASVEIAKEMTKATRSIEKSVKQIF